MAIHPSIQTLFSPEEVEQSWNRLNILLGDEYGTHPIYEHQNPIGACTFNKGELCISFRGSIGRIKEVVQIGLTTLATYKETGFGGHVHGNIYQKFLSCKNHLDQQINALLAQHQCSLENTPVLVEGYSQGSMFAALTAAYLTNRVGCKNIRILTFATLPLFDQQGLKSYNDRLETRHLSFISKDDKIALNPTVNQSLKSPGHTILFNAEIEATYLNRVQSKNWTLITPGAELLVGIVYNKRAWEAHMPQTYRGSKLALENFSHA